MAEETKLKKELTLLDVFCLATGAMISSGIFVLPGIAHGRAGASVFVCYIVAGLLASLGMLSQAELVSAMPKAGGDYFYVTRSLGPSIGTINGLVTWFSLSLKSAFALLGMGAFAALVLQVEPESLGPVMRYSAMGLCAVFMAINLIGVKEAGKLQVFLVVGLIAALVLYIGRGLPEINIQNFDPFTKEGGGFGSIFTTAGFVFVSYGGLLKIASIAEEVKDPGRTVPMGMILSLTVVVVLYALAVMVTTGVVGPAGLESSYTPISDGARVFMGPWGFRIMGVAAVLAFISTANAGVLAASRYPLALGRDGLLPGFLGRVNPRFKTPHFAILLTGGLMIGALFFDLGKLVKAASSVLILTYMFSCISVIILRESRLQNYQPSFRTPLYPWVQIAGIIGFGLLISEMGTAAHITTAIAILVGFVVYWFYGRAKAEGEYALLHLIERITAREMTSYSLETELKGIIQERDDILQDRFDRLVADSPVIDAEGHMTQADLFRTISEELSPRLGLEAEVIEKALVDREAQSETAINPTLAIPHIVIPGEKRFDILLARIRGGVRFSESAPRVETVFVLAGTADERNFHLTALAAIAQIVQDKGFRDRWLAAKSDQALRDTVLLAKRLRHEA